ncbi:pyridoxal phosphate-dependent aminotransferase [Microbacterium allomyrinae]|jgi:aspartate/methionine/tyrosine aminotransferase|uniref:Aminotransferase n=1 Tax=Microbacterium allomyrinae TaxID=2830666 RepID=A0A9X1S390_9MICO|nr:aminotransferase class I/II-fold pyridoxal phosphate-dependent enzyme [Microbacterium allomyrinae]MCC2032247.1 aminotransferase class I/II-fold pyridoxal phosphate-dependent enzyme [Microbacterium allomyrinae]
MPEIAPHVARMPGSGVRHILEMALRRPGTIILAVGEPGEVAGERIRDAAAEAWRQGAIRYTPNGGIPALREAIVDKLARENGLTVDVEQVWVTVGATQALYLAMSLTLSRGDEVLVPDPGYTTFTMNARLLQAEPVPYPLRPERSFQPDLAELESLITPRTRAIIVNTPSNPLGSTFDRPTLEALVDLARRHDLWIISDEVYERFTWGEPHVSPATLDDDGRVLSVFSMSKTHSMTGARVGWLVTPPGWRQTMLRVQEAVVSCVDEPAQRAALVALEGDQRDVLRAAAHYRDNLSAATAALDDRGLRYLTPTGAFYLWIDVAHVSGGDVMAWCERFLDESGVAVAPGTAFGASGEGWIRVCVASERDQLLEGLARIPAPA